MGKIIVRCPKCGFEKCYQDKIDTFHCGDNFIPERKYVYCPYCTTRLEKVIIKSSDVKYWSREHGGGDEV